MKLTCPNISASTFCLRQGLGKHISTGAEASPSGISGSNLGAVAVSPLPDLLFRSPLYGMKSHGGCGTRPSLSEPIIWLEKPCWMWESRAAFSSILGDSARGSELWEGNGAAFGEQMKLKETLGGIYWDCGRGYCSDQAKQSF